MSEKIQSDEYSTKFASRETIKKSSHFLKADCFVTKYIIVVI